MGTNNYKTQQHSYNHTDRLKTASRNKYMRLKLVLLDWNKNRKGCLWKQWPHKRTKSESWFYYVSSFTLRKHAYSNILKILPPKNENFQIKNSNIFHISAQNIDCGYSLEPPRRGGSNEYPQSVFLSRNKKNNVYPCKPQFYYIKVGFKGVKTT